MKCDISDKNKWIVMLGRIAILSFCSIGVMGMLVYMLKEDLFGVIACVALMAITSYTYFKR